MIHTQKELVRGLTCDEICLLETQGRLNPKDGNVLDGNTSVI
jgi:hypothetical protein